MKRYSFYWWTGPNYNKVHGVTYGDFKWPSRSEWMVPQYNNWEC